MKLGRSAGVWGAAEGPGVTESVSSEVRSCNPGEAAVAEAAEVEVLTFLL